jgi:hypothetical protein
MLCEVLEMHVGGLYDFVYMPCNLKKSNGSLSFGYAFVNFLRNEDAALAIDVLQGFSAWSVPSDKTMNVEWSNTCHGLERHIERYRNSPVMHPDVPEIAKPIIVRAGRREPFPAPTRRLCPPKH